MPNTRAIAAQVIQRVVSGGESLSAVLLETMPSVPSPNDRAFVQALSYGVCRWYWELEYLLGRLATKPIRDDYVRSLALVGLYQLKRMRVKPHAAVGETVAAAGRRIWAKPFLNALLRTYQRDQERLDAAIGGNDSAPASHPSWLVEKLRTDWPRDHDQILNENNQPPPMTLRVNRLRTARDSYLAILQQQHISAQCGQVSEDAVLIAKPVVVEDLPGFSEGLISVQDEAPQLAAGLLGARAGERVLDVCAAPGGKTTHLLEACPKLHELVALEISPERANRIRSNLTRTGLQATVLVGDATVISSWWDAVPFDRILLDAPCSATGVVRRHPDIKLLRKATDIAALAAQQRAILRAVWPTLKVGGRLLYITCSVLREENEQIIAWFLNAQPDAREVPIQAMWGRPLAHGRQILTGEGGMDGFFYACLTKLRN
jgi:16S rRNA (cytosine967-C5)-methyltransferase